MKRDDLHVKERYVCLEIRWLKFQFFTGDRASDLFLVVAHEGKCLADIFLGKLLEGDKNKSNSFVIKIFTDLVVCPVKGLLDFVRFEKSRNVDLSKGYLFRTVAECGRVVVRTSCSYSMVYERLRYYLSTLGIYERETPHSFRSVLLI